MFYRAATLPIAPSGGLRDNDGRPPKLMEAIMRKNTQLFSSIASL